MGCVGVLFTVLSVTLYDQYTYSPYGFTCISYCTEKENLFNNEEFLLLAVIPFTLEIATLMR